MIPDRQILARNGGLLRGLERKAPAPVVTLAAIEASVVAMSQRDPARAARMLYEVAGRLRRAS
jgi:hypothetical protein